MQAPVSASMVREDRNEGRGGLPAVAAVTPEAVEIDASVVAMGLGIDASKIPELIRLGEITSIVRHQGFGTTGAVS
ncbi:MAG: DUF6522 family protein [Mesorhizobium sp.]|nr:DUF6522 family protein [Mesorhizobium sp.]MCO5163985.1 DUF6522 family protein [Mesorhizobium sp.]